MVESSVCEWASRMTSMDAAARNAEEIIDDLTLDFNRKRQGAITQEITEIVSGANAIQ
jgi:F-type H+-transporting ATPase subunit gamma